jgi:hypothetical protein
MREDMFKVIVERPRRGGYCRNERRACEDEESPARESLRWRHRDRKWLNENLRPLERYLQQQIGRPWDKVYSEICAGIDRRSTVQQHIHQHVGDFVSTTIAVIAGEPHAIARWGEPRPLADYRAPRFYVEPRTGLLQVNRWRERARRERSSELPGRSDYRRELGPFLQLHQLDGLWFEVDLAPIPIDAGETGVFDVVSHHRVAAVGRQINGKRVVQCDTALYGKSDVYAWRKRQLGAPELRRHGLVNDRQ